MQKTTAERGITLRDFFSLDGPFNKYGGMVADMIILSFMWLIFSVIGLGITMGASTSALFFVTTRRIANREGYITRDFWEAFKANFKKATILWVIVVALLWLIWFNINNIQVVGGLSFIIFPAQIVLFIEITFMSVYAFPMTARFDMSIRQIIKSSFYMANRHLLTFITCTILLVGAVLGIVAIPPLALFLAPGIYGMLAAYMLMRVFKKYRPEMDKDPVLEIQEIEAQKAEERRKQSIRRVKDANLGGDGDERGPESEAEEGNTQATPIEEKAPTRAVERKLRSEPAKKVEPKGAAAKKELDFWASVEEGTPEEESATANFWDTVEEASTPPDEENPNTNFWDDVDQSSTPSEGGEDDEN